MSFGKKGVVPSQSAATAPTARAAGPRPASPVRPAAPDPHAVQREAFLAAERARRASSGEKLDQTDIPYPRRQPANGGYGLFGDPAKRTLLLACVFWYFCSPLGIHRIYCGAKDTGYIQMALFFGGLVLGLIWTPLGVLSIGAWFLWILANLFLIPGLMRRFKAEHRPDYGEVFA
jgi:hypothetical protein